jgi:inosine-uridine nucleoside N-ribohydrolase
MFVKPDYSDLTARLMRPTHPVDVLLDTDAFNEIDDQYAIAYLVANEPQLKVIGFTAAPFYRNPAEGVSRSKDPAEGMEQSYLEIIKILNLMGRIDLIGRVFRGSCSYLPSESKPVPSQAVTQILKISQQYDKRNPLYLLAIGAGTNVASALLTDPSLVDRCVVIWLGGHSLQFGDCSDFNISQDIAAARVIFGCGVPLVQFPCLGVVSEFRFSKPELEYWFRGKNKLCDYLIDNTYEFAMKKYGYEGWSKPIWDPVTITWLLEGDFLLDRYIPSPIPEYDRTYGINSDRHPIKYVYYVKKDTIIRDMAHKLSSLYCKN